MRVAGSNFWNHHHHSGIITHILYSTTSASEMPFVSDMVVKSVEEDEEEAIGLNDLFEDRIEEEKFFFKDIKSEYDGNNTVLSFSFSYCGRIHTESKFVIESCLPSDVRHSNVIFSIGMCILPWYWMAYGCKRIVIEERVYKGDSDVLKFWQCLYDNVLLEYLHENKAEAPVIELAESAPNVFPKKLHLEAQKIDNARVLLPIGGGKDSLVVWHMNKEKGLDPDLFHVRDSVDCPLQRNWRLQYIAHHAKKGYKTVEHTFGYDEIKVKGKSYLKPSGHPWAALCLFDSVLVAALNGNTSVQLGNEKSADFGNGVRERGIEVNHQYDKSSKFLHLAAAYISNYISADISVTSPLENFWDIEVAEIFCSSPYLKPLRRVFMSCNAPLDNTRWCNDCEKCCFVYLIMSAFLTPPEVWGIFGDNLFEKCKLSDTFLSLIGVSCNGKKPFECVGTFNESRAAVELSHFQFMKLFSRDELPSTDLPPVLKQMCDKLKSNENWSSIENNANVTSKSVIDKWMKRMHVE